MCEAGCSRVTHPSATFLQHVSQRIDQLARFSFDLHVLSTPPAFVLSQDQTLIKSLILLYYLLKLFLYVSSKYSLSSCLGSCHLLRGDLYSILKIEFIVKHFFKYFIFNFYLNLAYRAAVSDSFISIATNITSVNTIS